MIPLRAPATIDLLRMTLVPAAATLEVLAHDVEVEVEYRHQQTDDGAHAVVLSIKSLTSIHLAAPGGDFELIIKPGANLMYVLPDRQLERIEESLPGPGL